MPTATRKEVFRLSLKDALQATLDTVKNLKWTAVETKNGEIKARTRISLKTWGEEISIKILPESIGTSIIVTSTTSQLVDWGKNNDNLKDFFAQFTLGVLKSHLES